MLPAKIVLLIVAVYFTIRWVQAMVLSIAMGLGQGNITVTGATIPSWQTLLQTVSYVGFATLQWLV